MNKALFMSTLKSKYKLILICSAALVMYSVIIINMFDPNDAEASKAMIEMLPEGFVKAFGYDVIEPGLTAFLATTMYSMPYMIFMIAYTLIAANSLMARLVDRGSMACYLSTPVSRTKIAITQGSIIVFGQFIMAFLLTGLSVITARAMFGGEALELAPFIKLNFLGFMLFFVVGAFSFLFSCLFNDEKFSISCSAGLTVAFYAMNALGNMSEDLSWLNKLSIFNAFNPAKIVSGSVEVLYPAISFAVVGILLYSLALIIFNKRDLPL